MGIAALEVFTEITDKCTETLKASLKLGQYPNETKRFNRRFKITEIEHLVGRHRNTISKVLKEEMGYENINKGVTLEQVNELREHFGTSPNPRATSKAINVAVSSFKGGVSKSVTAVHFAQSCAMKGYKTLLVDLDPQASATSSFGYVPDEAFNVDDTIYEYFGSWCHRDFLNRFDLFYVDTVGLVQVQLDHYKVVYLFIWHYIRYLLAWSLAYCKTRA